MAKLKLGALLDDKPIKVTIELPAALHRDLIAYAEALASETGQPVSDPAKLIAPCSRDSSQATAPSQRRETSSRNLKASEGPGGQTSTTEPG